MNRRQLLTSAAMATAVAGLPRLAMAATKPKIGFIYVGPVNDGGWSQHHHESVLEMQKHFGDAIEVVSQESVPEGADAERAMTQMALTGCNLIFATSFGYMDQCVAVAKKFPKVKFEHATGYKTADNLAVYSARFYEGRAVCGHIAGKMTKTNKIGYLATFPIPEVIQGINSTYIHAKKANPDVEISVVWLSTWFDPAKEADGTKALLDQGVDIVLQHTDSTAPLATLQKSGGFGFGQAGDMKEFEPTRLSSVIDHWAPYYIERVQALIDNKWATANTWGGIASGMVGIGEFSSAMSDELKAEAGKLRDDISAGTYHPFTGPLNKQDGSPWLKEGETPDDGMLSGLNFYVEGIKSAIPG